MFLTLFFQRRIERAVQLLDKAPEIVQDICLLKPPKETGESILHDLKEADLRTTK